MKILFQIGIILGICFIGEVISSLLPISLPSSVIGMILLFALLSFRVLKIEQIQETGDFLLKVMAFFFLPAAVGIIENVEYLKNSILPLIFVVVVTTVLTFVATAYTVTAVIALQNKGGKK